MRSSPSLSPLAIVAIGGCNAMGPNFGRIAECLSDDAQRGAALLRPSPDFPEFGAVGQVASSNGGLPPGVDVPATRTARLAWQATAEIAEPIRGAVQRYGAHRIAVIVGSSTGGMDATEAAFAHRARHGSWPPDYDFESRHPYHALSDGLARQYSVSGPSFVISTACSSSAKALASAQRLVAADQVDAVVVCGVDALCRLTLAGFRSLGLLDEHPCRPFDGARRGLNLGEGATSLLLERVGAAAPFGYLLAVGESADAYHTTAPHPEGEGAARAMQEALQQGGVEAHQIAYVNAHGTATPLNDVAEFRAMRRVFGSEAGVLLASTKDRTGHLLGGAGAAECAFVAQALMSGVFPRNAPSLQPDPEIQLPPQPEAPQPKTQRGSAEFALSNSFAFGGSNASVLLGKTQPMAAPSRLERKPVYISGVALWSPESVRVDDLRQESFSRRAPGQERPKPACLAPRARGRASLLTAIHAELVCSLLNLTEPQSLQMPMLFGSCYGEMVTSVRLLEMLNRDDAAVSPALFQASVHNTSAGALSVALSNTRFTTSIAAGADTFAATLLEGVTWVSLVGGDALVLCADEGSVPDFEYERPFGPLGIGVRLSATRDETTLCQLDAPRRMAADERTLPWHLTPAELPEPWRANPSAGGIGLLMALVREQWGPVSLALAPSTGRYLTTLQPLEV